jgi:hypothetical protein
VELDVVLRWCCFHCQRLFSDCVCLGVSLFIFVELRRQHVNLKRVRLQFGRWRDLREVQQLFDVRN